VAQAQALSRITNGRGFISGRSSYLQKELMLLWLQANFLRRRLAVVQKEAELVAKLGERLKSACRFYDLFLVRYHPVINYIV
jgi:hypothetical protein